MTGGSSGRGTSRNQENLVNLGRSQEGEHCVGTGLMRKADSGSYKQNPTSPEKHGLASTHIT